MKQRRRSTVDELERRLDEVEDLLIRGFTSRDVIHYAQSPPEPGKPPRWLSGDASQPLEPMSEQGIRSYIRQALERIRARPNPAREENLRLAIAGGRRLYREACEKGELKEACAALRFTADLDGTRLAAEEASKPTLWQEIQALLARVRDFDAQRPFLGCADLPGDLDAALRADPGVAARWREALRGGALVPA